MGLDYLHVLSLFNTQKINVELEDHIVVVPIKILNDCFDCELTYEFHKVELFSHCLEPLSCFGIMQTWHTQRLLLPGKLTLSILLEVLNGNIHLNGKNSPLIINIQFAKLISAKLEDIAYNLLPRA